MQLKRLALESRLVCVGGWGAGRLRARGDPTEVKEGALHKQGTRILREDVISEWLLLNVRTKKPREGEAGAGVVIRLTQM